MGFVVAPLAFATLPRDMAGAIVSRWFSLEAHASLVLCVLLFLWGRRQARSRLKGGEGRSLFSADMLLVLAVLFCTIAGHFAVQPLMVAARAGQGNWSFATLHGVSAAFYGLKALLLVVLAWRATRR